MRQLTQLFWMTVLSFTDTLALTNCITLPRLAGMSMTNSSAGSCGDLPSHSPEKNKKIRRGNSNAEIYAEQ